MAATPTFCTAQGFWAVPFSDGTDGGADPDMVPVKADVKITYKVQSGGVLQAITLDTPTGIPVVPVWGKVVDGVLTDRLGNEDIRLLANTDVLGVDGDLFAHIEFRNATARGIPVTINEYDFLLPTSDTVVNVVEAGPVAGLTAKGQILGPPVFPVLVDPGPPALYQWTTATGVEVGAPMELTVVAGGANWVEYADVAAFPEEGEVGFEYLARDPGKIYRWNGTDYLEVSTGEPIITAGTTGQYWRGDKTWQTLDKAAAGLGNVDNTSDTNKPVSSAQQTALNAKQSTSEKNQNNGYCGLDSGGKVAAAQLPSTLMDYLGVWNASTNSPTLADGSGSAGDVYRVSTGGSRNLGSGSITFDVGDYVIYNGTVWEKSDTTDAVASVAGKTGIVTLVKGDVGLGNVDNTADSAKPVSTLQAAADTAVANASIAKATVDAKGDLIVGTANDTVARLAAGTDGLSLIADSSQTEGVRWGTPSGAGTGDVSSNTATSVDGEVALFSATGGKTIKRANSFTGLAKLASGVLSAVTAPSGTVVGTTDSQTLTNKTIDGSSNTISNVPTSALVLNAVTEAAVATTETTSSASYTDLTTTTDTVTVTIGASGKAIVIVSAFLLNTTAGLAAYMSFAASGANTIAADDSRALTVTTAVCASKTVYLSGLTAGSTTFKAKYKRGSGGTTSAQYRTITVIPL